MTTHSHSPIGTSAHFHLGPFLYQIGRIMLVAILFFSILLLGDSMVHHRFFRGGRIHQNGSLGE